MKPIMQVFKISIIVGLMSHVFNVVLFKLYPSYLTNEETNASSLENDFVADLLNIKHILFFIAVWVVICGLYFLLAKAGMAKRYRTISIVVVFIALAILMSGIGYSLHLMGYVLFIIFSAITFIVFYYLMEKSISKFSYS